MSGEIIEQKKPSVVPFYLALFGMLSMGMFLGGVLVYQALNGDEQAGICLPKNFYGVLYPPTYGFGDDYYIFNRTTIVKINASIDKQDYSCPTGLDGLCSNPYKYTTGFNNVSLIETLGD